MLAYAAQMLQRATSEVLLVLAIIGGIQLPLGVVGHEGSTLIVVANGLRLLMRREIALQ